MPESLHLSFVRLTGVVTLFLFGCFTAQAQAGRLSIPAPRAHYGPGPARYYPPAGVPAGPVVPPVLLPNRPLPPAPTSRDGARPRGFFRRRG